MVHIKTPSRWWKTFTFAFSCYINISKTFFACHKTEAFQCQHKKKTKSTVNLCAINLHHSIKNFKLMRLRLLVICSWEFLSFFVYNSSKLTQKKERKLVEFWVNAKSKSNPIFKSISRLKNFDLQLFQKLQVHESHNSCAHHHSCSCSDFSVVRWAWAMV